MSSYIPDVSDITSTIADLGTILTSFGDELPGPILAFAIPFALLAVILGLMGIILKILQGVVGKVTKKI